MTGLKRKLTIKDGIALGIGSIMGSGILFLPSLSYQLAGQDVLTAWALTTAFCVPLLLIFSDMVKAVPNEHGIGGFLELGLGKHLAASTPILLLGTVGIGMPSAALIAARYLTRYIGGGSLVAAITALTLIAVSVAANLLGVRTGSLFQRIVAFGLFVLGVALFALTLPLALPKLADIHPVWDLKLILTGSVVAFWAFAGFENMTFTAGEFKNPHRDIMVSIATSLLLCGALYIGLTANFVALIPADRVDTIVGLSQLAEVTSQKAAAAFLVTMFAIGAVLINLTSWSWGISRLVFASGGNGALPRYFGVLSKNDVPKRALLGMFFLFSTVVLLATIFPAWFESGLQVVSTNFVFLYLLSLVSYTIYSKNKWKKALGVVLSALLVFTLTTSGWLLLYPIALTGLAALRSWKYERYEAKGGI